MALLGANAQAVNKPSEVEINKLLNGFSTAIVKKDKAWLSANLSTECIMEVTGSGTFDKAKIIYVFTEGVYNISKSVFMDKKITVSADSAKVNTAMEVEGTMSIEGRVEDISSVYIFDVKVNKVTTGWVISEILIKEDK